MTKEELKALPCKCIGCPDCKGTGQFRYGEGQFMDDSWETCDHCDGGISEVCDRCRELEDGEYDEY